MIGPLFRYDQRSVPPPAYLSCIGITPRRYTSCVGLSYLFGLDQKEEHTYRAFSNMQRSDLDKLDKENEEFDPPFKPPPPAVCTELWTAARQGHNEFEQFMRDQDSAGWCVTRLLCSSNELGQNFLHIAAETGDWRTIYVLVRLFTTRHPPHPLHVIIPRKRLPTQPDMDGNTPLHIAAIHDHLDFAKALLKYYNRDPIDDPLDPDDVKGEAGGVGDFPMSVYRLEFIPRLRFFLDCKNHEALAASQAGFAAGAVTTASWLEAFRKQGVVGIELQPGEESDDHSLSQERWTLRPPIPRKSSRTAKNTT